MYTTVKYFIVIIFIIVLGVGSYIFWPMIYTPTPADCECLVVNNDTGKLAPLQIDRKNVYGVALTYAGIISQSGSEYHPGKTPPIFRKLQQAITTGNMVKYPNQKSLLDQIEKIEAGLSKTLQDEFKILPVLMDYEVELGIVVLDDISRDQLADPAFSPKLGYFLANDLQSIIFGVLGLGIELESKYFDAKGSFPGFLPISKFMWIPKSEKANSTLCIDIKTTVNGELRQKENTKNRIYSNKEILGFILRTYNKEKLTKGTAIITGSPAGVANKISRWKRRLGNLLKMNRLNKLSSIFTAVKQDNKFLQPGDVVVVEGALFGSIRTEIIR
ncbi:MAG: fumarylacetoacetate hydrolase family protein [Deltaproteobacteria bacterium]|nr:fumarylacetoacetate hydrolase family protein [Deltaproteobacteria bacterium]